MDRGPGDGLWGGTYRDKPNNTGLTSPRNPVISALSHPSLPSPRSPTPAWRYGGGLFLLAAAVQTPGRRRGEGGGGGEDIRQDLRPMKSACAGAGSGEC